MERIPQPSQENEKKMEKDGFRQAIESLHKEIINFRPLEKERSEMWHKYSGGSYKSTSELEKEFSLSERERMREIKEREKILDKKIQEQNKKGVEIFYKNFFPSDWKIEENTGIYTGGKRCITDIGSGYSFNVNFYEIDPGQPIWDPISKDKYTRSYQAYINGSKKIKKGLFKKSEWDDFTSLGNYAEVSFEDDKSISERKNEFEGKDKFEKELIGLANKLGGIQK